MDRNRSTYYNNKLNQKKERRKDKNSTDYEESYLQKQYFEEQVKR